MSVAIQTKLSKGLAFAVLIALGIFISTATDASVRFHYAITDLGGGSASDINEAGQVVGLANTNKLFVWQNGRRTDLPTLCNASSSPPRINNAGQIAGTCGSAYFWENGTKTDLGLTIVYGINDAGAVVGMSKEGHAVVWEKGEITDLGTLAKFPSIAQGINNKGQVVGVSSIKTDGLTYYEQHTFLWQNGVMTDLGELFFLSPSPGIRINNKGQIAGTSIAQGFRALLWQNGNVTDLGTLGGGQSTVYDINNVGTVVGSSETSNNGSHAFVSRNGRMRDLNSLLRPNSGWELISAFGINDKGQIVGYGKYNGVDGRAFLLTPTLVTR